MRASRLALAFIAALLAPASGGAQLYELTPIAVEGDVAPGTGGGSFTDFRWGDGAINAAGDVAFKAIWEGGTSGSGIFLVSEGVVSAPLVSSGDVAPGTGGGTFTYFYGVDLNDAGTIAFTASYDTGGSTEEGIFAFSGGSLSPVVLTGDAAPGGGTYASFFALNNRSLNASGEIAFGATLSGGTAERGHFASAGGVDRALVLLGDAAPTPAGGTWSVLAEGPRIDDFGNSFIVGAATDGVLTQTQIVRVRAGGGTDLVIAQNLSFPPNPLDDCQGYGEICVFDLSNPMPNALGDLVFVGELADRDWPNKPFPPTILKASEGEYLLALRSEACSEPPPGAVLMMGADVGGFNRAGAMAYNCSFGDSGASLSFSVVELQTRTARSVVLRNGDAVPGSGGAQVFAMPGAVDQSDNGTVLIFTWFGEEWDPWESPAGFFTATRVAPDLPALSPPALGALVGGLLALGLLALKRAASRSG